MKKYSADSMKSYKAASGDVGCVKYAGEEKYAMVDTGGKKYSYNNPMELKQKGDKLAKVLDAK